jgi:hypothetical protein
MAMVGAGQVLFRRRRTWGIHGAMPRLSWSRKLTRPIVVKHGRPGEVKTLADARALIHSLPARRQQQPAWQRAAELLFKAAGSRAPQDLADATGQLYRALASEGWL